jgi:hypothetical protein
MDSEAARQEHALREQLKQAEGKLAGLGRDLRVADGELDDLAAERQQYRLVHDACTALEALGELSGSPLFWGERADAGEDHLRRARGRLDAFEKRLGGIEARREALADEIDRWQGHAEVVEDDIFELQRREEERKLEWVIEREISDHPARESVMPWSRGGEEDERFRKALATSLLVCVLPGLVLSLVDLPLPEPWEASEVPERLTRLIREERPLPPAQPTPAEPVPTEEAPVVAEEAKPEAEKEDVASRGILAFREKFSELAATHPSPRLGAQARITSSGEAAPGRQERAMVTTQAPGSSGGINLAALSRELGGGGGGELDGVEVARATSSIGALSGSQRPLSEGPVPARTDEEIQIVFDRHKAALYRLYNRELRRDPTLKGQMVLRLRIEPDGSVSLCELRSSDMDAPQLSAQVVGRVRTFDFGVQDVPAITILYPIDFLPAT